MYETLPNPSVENAFVKLELWPNGILYALYLKKTRIDLQAAKDIVKMRLAFTGNRPYPVLIRVEGITSLTQEARKYIYSPDAIEGLTAAVFLTDSAFASTIANLFMSIHNPLKIPVTARHSQASAVKWLLKYSLNEEQKK